MNLPRCSGILLHPTSLPGRFGIGDLGPECYRFLDFLHESKQRLWHVLPLGPTGSDNSPYQSDSAFAGNPLLISPEKLRDAGYLDRRDLSSVPKFSQRRVQFAQVRNYKARLFLRAFAGFSESAAYRRFEAAHSWWLDPYARFMGLRAANRGVSWTEFDPAVPPRSEIVRFHKFLQYEFFRQWSEVKAHCAKRNVLIMGDMPFYVQHDGADVWQFSKFFDLDRKGAARTVGGVPPDYFSKDGQLWGNPCYRWKEMEKSGYEWWVQRFASALELVDLLRVDHFRGFVKFWSVPAGHATARKGRWITGPGIKLFNRIHKRLGHLPLIAENLGVITPAVEKLRSEIGLPGMVVLQFGFDEGGTHRPNNYDRNLVCFTGTHDNNTTRGWWEELTRAANENPRSAANAELKRVKAYFHCDGRSIAWSFVQAAMTSIADIAILPMQDVLELGCAGRMNVPGRAKGNWNWRYDEKAITPELTCRLHSLAEVSGR